MEGERYGVEGAWMTSALKPVLSVARGSATESTTPNILVCDGCEEEWYIYCLSLIFSPEEPEWHREKCRVSPRGAKARGRPRDQAAPSGESG